MSEEQDQENQEQGSEKQSPHPSGVHFLVDFYECDAAVLDNLKIVEAALCAASNAIGSKIVARAFHRYTPQGVTGVLVIEESHLAIHTWPETGYAAMDIFTCGDLDPRPALEIVETQLKAKRSETLLVHRGEDPEED